MKHSEFTAKYIIGMLLGSTVNNVRGVIVDDTITYLSELEDGYEDFNLPVIAAYTSEHDDEPFFVCSINDIRSTATIHTDTGVYITLDTEAYGSTVIIPLVQMGEYKEPNRWKAVDREGNEPWHEFVATDEASAKQWVKDYLEGDHWIVYNITEE